MMLSNNSKYHLLFSSFDFQTFGYILLNLGKWIPNFSSNWVNFRDHEDRFMTPNFMMKTNFTPLEKRRKQLCCWYVFSNSTFLVFRLIKQGEKEGENLDPT